MLVDLFWRWFGLPQALIGAEDDVGADRRGIVARELLVERNHAGLLELTLQNDIKPPIVVEGAGVAQVREDATADGNVTVAQRTDVLVEGFPFVDHRGARGGLRRFQLGRRELREWGQACFAAKFEGEEAVDILRAAS